ncbi:MAG: hypothetical protein HQK60_10280 [Deltaproteobacteria bacterium]|nr:hypothetical protein [Deltaproteobacteria bacterium]
MFKPLILALMAFVCLMTAAPAQAERFKVKLERVGFNLYRDTLSGLYIKTRFCFEVSVGEPAILQYDRPYGNNKLIFVNRATCDVEKVIQFKDK